VLRFTTTVTRPRLTIMRKGVKSLIGGTGILPVILFWTGKMPVPPILSGIRDRIYAIEHQVVTVHLCGEPAARRKAHAVLPSQMAH